MKTARPGVSNVPRQLRRHESKPLALSLRNANGQWPIRQWLHKARPTFVAPPSQNRLSERRSPVPGHLAREVLSPSPPDLAQACPLPFFLNALHGSQGAQRLTQRLAIPRFGPSPARRFPDGGCVPQLQGREDSIATKGTSQGGWVVNVVLHRKVDEVGTKYEVKTIYASRMEAEISGLAVARVSSIRAFTVEHRPHRSSFTRLAWKKSK
jgi:hypothetical protein